MWNFVKRRTSRLRDFPPSDPEILDDVIIRPVSNRNNHDYKLTTTSEQEKEIVRRLMGNGSKTPEGGCACLDRVSAERATDGHPAMPDTDTEDSDCGSQCTEEQRQACEGMARIHKLAALGKTHEFEKLVLADQKKLSLRDSRGRTPLHHAAKRGRLALLDFIISQGADMDAQDNCGNTPLHSAVEGRQVESTDLLLVRGANAEILNENQTAPIHLSVTDNKIEVLKVFLKHKDKVDINLDGDNGATPLHYAAWHNRARIAHLLLEHGARLCKPCRVGLYPMHLAAQNGSSDTLKVFIKYAEKAGYKAEDLLKFVTKHSRNTPLHAAINGGDLQAVKMCMEAGSEIDATQDDGSTAVHLACAHGSVPALKLMFSMQPEKKEACIQATDLLQMTALHKAALFDRGEAVEYMLKEGADVNALDSMDQTPLLLAASKGAWSVIDTLLTNKADCSLRDRNNRNILHLIIISGGKLSSFNYFSCNARCKEMLDEKDEFGCTPLHYASKHGQLGTITDLIELGAALNAKNNDKQSPLHFAARYGRYNTCRRLLEQCSSSANHNAVNDTDGEGQSPLHAAAQNGHTKVVSLLLHSGAGMFRDIKGNTPLHLAAENGYTHTMELLLGTHSYLIDATNRDGDTALNLAARAGQSGAVTMLLSLGAALKVNGEGLHLLDEAVKNEQKDVCVAIVSHDRWQECLQMESTLYGCPMSGVIQVMPEVCQMLLDRCRTVSGPNSKDPNFHYIYDFQYLQASKEKARQLKQEGKDPMPLFALNTMVTFNRVECLSHPVCLSFLAMKWRAYGVWFHMINLLIYMMFLACLTTFVVAYDLDSPERVTDVVNTTMASTDKKMKLSPGQHMLVYVVVVFCSLNIVKEILQMFQQKIKYLTDLNNLLEWILYVMTMVYMAPFLAGVDEPAQWACGAIAVFLAWFNLLLFLQRFDIFGIYVVMFLEILKTLVQALMIFSILIIAFGLSFYILLYHGEKSYGHKTAGLSLISTGVMMLGNIEYIDNWVLPYHDGSLTNQTVSFIMLMLFILLMPILLINLLIGLAVGDIESVQQNARLKRLAMQVELHTDLERKLPRRLLDFVDRPVYKVYPNCSHYLFSKIWNKATKARGVAYDPTLDVPQDHTLDKQTEHHSYMYSELNKQKRRLKDLSSDLSKQYDLLRLIVQKMEIRTEADEVDEGGSDHQADKDPLKGIGWSSATIRHTVMKQASVISKMRSLTSVKCVPK